MNMDPKHCLKLNKIQSYLLRILVFCVQYSHLISLSLQAELTLLYIPIHVALLYFTIELARVLNAELTLYLGFYFILRSYLT